jgi:gas vesicle protein
MADDASRALGAPEIAGTFVNPKGLTKKMTASAAGSELGGAIGSVAANLIADRSSGAAAEMPSFGRVGYLAVSDSELALVKTKTGAFKMKISDEILARVPRADVASVELDQGRLLSRLKIAFSNGVTWQFDVPKQAKKTAQGLTRVLGGELS